MLPGRVPHIGRLSKKTEERSAESIRVDTARAGAGSPSNVGKNVFTKQHTQGVVFPPGTVDRPVSALSCRDADADVGAPAAPGARHGVRGALRSAACPHVGAVPDAGRDVRLRALQTLCRADARRGPECDVAGSCDVVRALVGDDFGPEQIHPGDARVAVAEPYAGNARRGDGLCGELPAEPGPGGQDADAGRFVRAGGAQSGRGPFGAADPRDDVLERLVPGPADRDGDHPGFRCEMRGDLPRMHGRTHHGLCGGSVVEPGADAPRAGVHRAVGTCWRCGPTWRCSPTAGWSSPPTGARSRS